MGAHTLCSNNIMARAVGPLGFMGFRVRAAATSQYAWPQAALASVDTLCPVRHHRLYIRLAGVQRTQWVHSRPDHDESGRVCGVCLLPGGCVPARRVSRPDFWTRKAGQTAKEGYRLVPERREGRLGTDWCLCVTDCVHCVGDDAGKDDYIL